MTSCLWCRKRGGLCPEHLEQRRARWATFWNIVGLLSVVPTAFVVGVGCAKAVQLITDALRAVCG